SADAAGDHTIARDNPIPTPPFWGRRVVTDLSPRHLFPYINTTALFRGQWGFKQGKLSPEEFDRLTEEKARPVFEDLQRRAMDEGFIQPKVVYGYFPVQSEGNDLIVYRPEDRGSEWLRFAFPRQEGRRRLCIADFFRSKQSQQFDVL